MLSLTHTLVSLPFGIYFQNPVLIFIAAFIFHLLCDTLLHWNIFYQHYKNYPYRFVALDVSIGLLIAWLFLGNNFFTLSTWAAIVGGNAPDVLQAIWEKLSPRQRKGWFAFAAPFFSFHDKLQWETIDPLVGIISQIILISIALSFLT